MKILVVSGFLGAGKTTFITQMVKNFPNRRFAIYENEFAGQGIDTDRLKDDLEVDIYESLENCVCCSGKADFSASIITISCSVNPEFLIVEPTGLAKLGNVIQNIQQILYGDISLLEPALILDAHAHKRNWNLSPEIYEDQICNSRIIFLSKTSFLITEEIEAVKRDVLRLNPDAQIIDTDFRSFGRDIFWQLLNLPFGSIFTGVRDKLEIGDGDKFAPGDFFTGVRDKSESDAFFTGDGDKFSWREHLSLTPLQKQADAGDSCASELISDTTANDEHLSLTPLQKQADAGDSCASELISDTTANDEHLSLTPLQKCPGTGVSPRPSFISDTTANHNESHDHHHHHEEGCGCDECRAAGNLSHEHDSGHLHEKHHNHAEQHETSGFEQMTFDEIGFETPVHLIAFLNGLVWGSCGEVARAKGCVPCGKEWLKFDLVDTIWEIADSTPKDQPSCIVIGKNLQKSKIKALL
ncbi:MAG: GTP-binding protein [Phoenicibacter congonensis]|uniref:GTP-binding protein n=1 Tax=Phoenicibacter congonensis TaxID=1944646 RepID=A0AA43RHL3_9ACTN|nr:GTP-binding protein [Phoenicibacter congonensis]